MIHQTFIHVGNKNTFDTELDKHLQEGWRVVPGTYSFSKTSRKTSTAVEQEFYMTDERYFIALEQEDGVK